jgi:uncharacterized RDD family membrane protein YckC
VVAATVAIQPGLSNARVPYAGIATRAIALVVDVLIIHAILLVAAGLLGLVATLVGDLRPEWLVATLVGCAWGLTVTVYFVLCWSITGQTPGMRAMRLRVVAGDGTPPSLWRALVRLVGLLLAIVPLFAGFLPVLFDARRRGLPDYLARTVVLYADRIPADAHGVVTGGP